LIFSQLRIPSVCIM